MSTAQILFETPRLIARPLAASDAADLRRIVVDPSVGPMLLFFSPDFSHEDAQAFIARAAFTGRLPLRLALVLKEGDGRMIGSVGAINDDPVVVAYFLDPDHAGQGLATEAMRGFCRWLFATFDAGELTADAFTDNPASDHILRKIGFERGGTAMGTSAARLEPAPVYLYRLAKARFESLTQ